MALKANIRKEKGSELRRGAMGYVSSIATGVA